jgi:hypothetical protein
MLYHWAHSSLCFKGIMIFWNMWKICPETQRNIRIRTEYLVTPPWQTQILHNSQLHAILHMNSQWTSEINTNQLIPWGRVLSVELTIPQLVKKFPKFHGTPSFVTTFTSTCYLSVSWAWSIQSIPAHPTSWRSILIFHSHLCLGFVNSPIHSGLSTTILHAPLLSPIHATCPTHLILLYKTAQFKQIFVSVELQLFDVTTCCLVESCWGCVGTCRLHRQVKINECSNQSRQNTVSHTNWSAELAATS